MWNGVFHQFQDKVRHDSCFVHPSVLVFRCLLFDVSLLASSGFEFHVSAHDRKEDASSETVNNTLHESVWKDQVTSAIIGGYNYFIYAESAQWLLFKKNTIRWSDILHFVSVILCTFLWFSSIFCSFEPFPAVIVWRWDPSSDWRHMRDSNTTITTLEESSPTSTSKLAFSCYV